MPDPCDACGATALVALLIPGHDHVEAVICLTCGAVQREAQGSVARPPSTA